jgi:chemotaxis protein histidine kinase CheA
MAASTIAQGKSMSPERQQRIIGYFVEEAKAHLDTIEQRLPNLPSRLDKHWIINDLLCASHSLAGSAAMLGLDSIYRTGTCLKYCFQILQLEGSVKIDQKLKSLFMQVFDGLKELVNQLNYPSGVADAKAEIVMSEIEPLLGEIKDYIDVLVKRSQEETSAFDEEFLSLFDDFLVE